MVSKLWSRLVFILRHPLQALFTEFRGFLKDLLGWDSLHKDSSNESKGPVHKAAKLDSNGGNHKHELKASMQDLASRAASQVMTTAPKIITTPTSASQFEVSWRALSDDSVKQVQLLKAIPPSDLPKIFKHLLSAHVLIDIVRCIATFFRDDTSLAVSMIDNLTNVPRFDLIIMLLSATDRAVMDKLWEEVFLSNQIQQDLRQALVKLRPKYCFGELESHILSS